MLEYKSISNKQHTFFTNYIFQLYEKDEFNISILKCDYIRYSPAKKQTINTANSQVCISIPRKDSLFPMLISYLDLNFDVLHAAIGNRYADGDDIRLVKVGKGSIVLSSNNMLTTSAGKHPEDITHAYIVSSMYKITTSAKDCNYLSIGFDRYRARRQRELTDNKNEKGIYHVRIRLKYVIGFPEHQEKAPYGLGYNSVLTRSNDNSVLNEASATNNAKIKNIDFDWYVPHYTPSIPQKILLSRQILSETPMELQYVERFIFLKEVKTQVLWTFESRTQEGINVPI